VIRDLQLLELGMNSEMVRSREAGRKSRSFVRLPIVENH